MDSLNNVIALEMEFFPSQTYFILLLAFYLLCFFFTGFSKLFQQCSFSVSFRVSVVSVGLLSAQLCLVRDYLECLELIGLPVLPGGSVGMLGHVFSEYPLLS